MEIGRWSGGVELDIARYFPHWKRKFNKSRLPFPFKLCRQKISLTVNKVIVLLKNASEKPYQGKYKCL